MKEILVKYRTWHLGTAPRPTRLQMPGWAGQNRDHGNGATPQPWHCPPFVDASTYGHELVYPFKSESTVRRINGDLIFDGDFSDEQWSINEAGMSVSGTDSVTLSLDGITPPDSTASFTFLSKTGTHPDSLYAISAQPAVFVYGVPLPISTIKENLHTFR